MSEWHMVFNKLPMVLASVEAVWSDDDEPAVVVYTGDGDWMEDDLQYNVPTPLKWREVEK